MADFVERGRLKEAISADCQHLFSFDGSLYELFMIDIDEIPAADVVQVVHGQWEPGDPICPACGENKFKGLDADVWSDWQPPFCPNCGAKMDLEGASA